MADLKETLYRKLFNVALTNIETVNTIFKEASKIENYNNRRQPLF